MGVTIAVTEKGEKMARYIDADALLLDIQQGIKFGQLTVCEIIHKQPTAEVKPVVRGEWTDTTHGLICSACKTYQVYGSRFYNFCPICGADMRGDLPQHKIVKSQIKDSDFFD